MASQNLPLYPPPSTASLSSHNRYNFVGCAAYDDIVYGSERPGYLHPSRDQVITPRGPNTKTDVIQEWMEYMEKQDIKRILCLLTPDEMQFYSSNLLDTLREKFQFVQHVLLFTGHAPLTEIMQALEAAEKNQVKIAIHCSSGQFRTGIVQALWLHRRYHLTIDRAVEAIIQHAKKHKAVRKPTMEGLMRLLLGTLAPHPQSTPRLGPLFQNLSLESTTTTPRPYHHDEQEQHIFFLQMGGTIDKDFSTREGCEIITDSAVREILAPPVYTSFSHDIITVCRKSESQDRISDDDDREELVRHLEVVKNKSTTDGSKIQIIITHGMETLLETASYLDHHHQALMETTDMTIVFTGALRPQKMRQSDAAFNLGVAIGALSALDSGIYIAMNGHVIKSSECRRDIQTGKFVRK